MGRDGYSSYKSPHVGDVVRLNEFGQQMTGARMRLDHVVTEVGPPGWYDFGERSAPTVKVDPPIDGHLLSVYFNKAKERKQMQSTVQDLPLTVNDAGWPLHLNVNDLLYVRVRDGSFIDETTGVGDSTLYVRVAPSGKLDMSAFFQPLIPANKDEGIEKRYSLMSMTQVDDASAPEKMAARGLTPITIPSGYQTE